MTPDLLNFKKGWMSKLDEDGEWRKHWFVLTDTSLRYYRDSEAEEKDDLDGEISLLYCVKVSECDVDKNYGFQIETQEAVFTLSAVTSGIRKNWVEVITKTVLPCSSPDITQRSRGGPGQGDPLHAPPPNAVRARATWGRARDSATAERPGGSSSRGQEGKLEKGRPPSSPGSAVGWLEEDVEKRWAEFERRPLREAESPPLMVTLGDHPDDEALQREVETLRQQLAGLQSDGDVVECGQCGPGADWGRSLEVMERAHRQALEELQQRHDQELRELQREKERLLREETQATAQAMEALKKAHREELEREIEIEQLGRCGPQTHKSTVVSQAAYTLVCLCVCVHMRVCMRVCVHTRAYPLCTECVSLCRPLRSETLGLQRELDDLSERYSQKCLELNRAEQSNAEREREISRREREMAQLRRENQELESRLKDEISHVSPFITGQGSGVSVSLSSHELSSCDLEMLLRVKENELQYLHREVSCLRDELHSLIKEKRSACDRYKEVYTELGRMKSRSEQEIEALKEHLKLAMAALQEGQQLENNLEH
ncbi:TRIO and F-actin-binding protein-like [Anguilla rostrata]|uniref:TRIO and F-actin-binding protein-like n=1 Tax=Anguilla rostrata TaxID=7938 RepID=UPI0030D61785